MEWRLVIDPEATDVTVTVTAPAETEEVRRIEALLTPFAPIHGFRGDEAMTLPPEKVVRFATNGKGVTAETVDGERFDVRLRLYELEERLRGRDFARTSQSELVNLRLIRALDLTFSGTIRLTMEGGSVSWVSRRNVKSFKKALGL